MSTVSALRNRTLEQLKVPELKEELRKRGILPKGLKKELVERLEQALREEAQLGNFGAQYVPRHSSEDKANVFEQEDIIYAFKPQDDVIHASKAQEYAPDVSKIQENALHTSELQEHEYQETPDSGPSKENSSPYVDNVGIETYSEPELSALPPQFPPDEVKLEAPLVETLNEAEEMKTLHPVPREGESVEAICPSEERKTADETSLPVTTGFEIASSADMETDVIVQSVPGFSHDSDLLPGTLCEAGIQSHPQLSACQVSVNLHQMGNTVEKLGHEVKVDQIGLDFMHINGCNEVKSEQVMDVKSVAPLEKVEEGRSLLPSSTHTEFKQIAELSQHITDGTPVVVKVSTEISPDQGKIGLALHEEDLCGVSDPSILESEPLANTVEEKFFKLSESVETVELLIPEEITIEDKSVETLVPEQIVMEDKIVNEKSLVISENNISRLDSLTKAVSGVPESVSGDAFVGGTKTRGDVISVAKDVGEDRLIEPTKRFEEKIRSREGLDVRMKNNEVKRSDREAPKDGRELTRSRLSQEGIAKVKEEVEKARPKDRGRVESGFRRTEPRVKRDSVEVKVELQTSKEELGGKGDSRRDDESKVRDIKPMDVDPDVPAGLKRKVSDEDSRQVEPLKRQRRWNSGNNIKTDSDVKPVSKSMNTERGKDTISYIKTETGNDSSLPASMLSPASSEGAKPISKGLVTGHFDQHLGSRHASYASKSYDASNGESPRKRIVPAPTRAATMSLRIDRFLRPFTLNAVKELLAQTGTYQNFWMDHIKSHCYVTYSTVEEAIATRNALYNLQWPPVGGKMLVAEFVDPDEVKDKCENAIDKSNVTPVTNLRAAPSLNDQISPSSAGRNIGSNLLPMLTLPSPPPQKEKAITPPNKEQEPVIPTLDDLFKKTRAKPHIYYFPLTEEQANTKLARSKASISKAATRT